MANKLSESPYNNTFNENNNFVHVSFLPKRPVQNRELNELQSIQTSQIQQFMSHIFGDNTSIKDGQMSVQDVYWVKVNSTFADIQINLDEFKNQNIIEYDSENNETGGYIRVVDVFHDTETDSYLLYYVYPQEFKELTNGNILTVEDTTISAKILNEEDTFGQAKLISLTDGLFFIDGYSVYVPAQSIIAEPYTPFINGVAGLEYEDIIITEDDDITLLDPVKNGISAKESPGAHRLKYDVVLKWYNNNDEAPNNFITRLSLENGAVKNNVKIPIYSDVGVELARRTNDAHGSFTVKSFKVDIENNTRLPVLSITFSGEVLENIATVKTSFQHGLSIGDSITISGVENEDVYNGNFVVDSIIDEYNFTYLLSSAPIENATGFDIGLQVDDYYSAILSPGKAYVNGYERNFQYKSIVNGKKGRDTITVQNYSTAINYGNYVIVNNLNGVFKPNNLTFVSLYDTNNDSIGTARLRSLKHNSGVPGVNSTTYKLYLYDFDIDSGYSFADVTAIQDLINGASATIAPSGKENNKTKLFGNNLNTLLFSIPQSYIKTLQPNGNLDTSYISTKLLENPLSGNSASFNVSGNQYFIGPIGSNFVDTESHYKYFHFIDSTTGNVLNPTSIEITSTGQQINVTFSQSNLNISLYCAVQNTIKEPRTKELKFGEVYVLPEDFSNGMASLNISDVYSIEGVYMAQNETELPTDLSTDVTSNYTLDGGQRDNYYDHGKIIGDVPDYRLLVKIKYFEHTGDGYITVDSYTGIEYKDIPIYTADNGVAYRLADVIDFRPVRAQNGTNHISDDIPYDGSLFTSEYEFYLPKKDKLVLYEIGQLAIVEGESSLNPRLPATPDDAMVLFELFIPPYTEDVEDIQIKYVDNKTYTMKDIGVLDKRITRLEQEVALSLLEMDTRGASVTDENGLDRFKTGFLVDNFSSFAIGDTSNGDFKSSIDTINRELRPSFYSEAVDLKYSASSSNARQLTSDDGEFVTLPFTEKLFLNNNIASTAESVNPYLIIDYVGTIKCNPSGDNWMDTKRTPAVKVNLNGNADNWNKLANAINKSQGSGFGTQWGDWNTTWTGTTSSTVSERELTGMRIWGSIFTDRTTTTTTTTNKDIARGTNTSLSFGNQTTSLGDKVVDVNLAYYMRAIKIQFKAFGLRPNTDYHVFFDEQKVNNLVSNVSLSPQSEGVVRSNRNGILAGTLSIPGGKFKVGDRTLTVSSDPNNVRENAKAYADFVFTSQGLKVTKQEQIVSTRNPVIKTTQVTKSRTTTSSTVNVTESTDTVPRRPIRNPDPLAQTFFINLESHPNGIFVSSIDVFMKRKPSENIPLEVHLRPTVNGFPHSSVIVPLSLQYIEMGDVKIPSKTDNITSIRNSYTRVKFDIPIHLSPGEWAVILKSNSADYEAYVGVLGQNILGTNKKIDKQQSFGSLFKSQNATTWTPFQFQDLMLRINRCSFNTNTTSTVILENDFTENLTKKLNIVSFNPSIINFNGVTKSIYKFKYKSNLTKQMSAWKNIFESSDLNIGTEGIVDGNKTLLTRIEMSTTDDAVSPILDLTNNNMICVENIVNNLGLLESGFKIIDPGINYTIAPTINIISDNGSNAKFEAIIENGFIIDVKMIQPGSGYITNPTITLSGGNGSGGNIIYDGMETNINGGNSLARYITRRVELAEDFECDYLTVYLDAYIPGGTDVKVYYKSLAADDNEIFENRPWIEMVKENSNIISGSENDFKEVKYVPVDGSISYTDDSGIFFEKSKIISIKIVMLSNNTSIVPLVRDFRSITTIG